MKLWIARDKDGLLTIYNEKPELHYGEYWDGDYNTQVIDIPKEMFPEITFENSPQEVKIKLKNKLSFEEMEELIDDLI